MLIFRQGVFKEVSEAKYEQVFKQRGYEPVLEDEMPKETGDKKPKKTGDKKPKKPSGKKVDKPQTPDPPEDEPQTPDPPEDEKEVKNA